MGPQNRADGGVEDEDPSDGGESERYHALR